MHICSTIHYQEKGRPAYMAQLAIPLSNYPRNWLPSITLNSITIWFRWSAHWDNRCLILAFCVCIDLPSQPFARKCHRNKMGYVCITRWPRWWAIFISQATTEWIWEDENWRGLAFGKIWNPSKYHQQSDSKQRILVTIQRSAFHDEKKWSESEPGKAHCVLQTTEEETWVAKKIWYW